LTQLRTNHVGLNAFLARTRVVSSPLCPSCQVPETVDHYLRACRRFDQPRHALRRSLGKKPLTLKHLLGDPKCRSSLLEFVDATGRFA
ncbi:uncharacterized protein TRAVEDRAFT_83733, partial [Trametes versicolor FP-101664 SS1]|uniref:uncharacterized protein n=1 Tax=Trametes versicolor (strain FP-101664) TaxID=717944 RepID=UPI000462365A